MQVIYVNRNGQDRWETSNDETLWTDASGLNNPCPCLGTYFKKNVEV